jgi:hypothetical protein
MNIETSEQYGVAYEVSGGIFIAKGFTEKKQAISQTLRFIFKQ